MGRPGAERFIDHGMAFLWNGHRDSKNGGYFWGVGEDGPSDDRKQAYGHAFVLLAAASAKVAGHPDADRLLADVSEVLALAVLGGEARRGRGGVQPPTGQPISRYRGQNSNMHLTEALMAAFEATGDNMYLEMAESIATLIIRRHAAESGWRVAEHFDESWQLDRDYFGGDVFRPSRHDARPFARMDAASAAALGARRAPARLAARSGQGALRPRRRRWLGSRARRLLLHARLERDAASQEPPLVALRGRDRRRGVPERDRAGRSTRTGTESIWDFVANRLIDRENGGWRTEAGRPGAFAGLFEGKPDLYHALQACLIPLLPTSGTITRGLATVGLK